MNAIDSIYTAIVDTQTLCGFTYNGKDANIDPGYVAGEPDSFLLWFAGDEKIVHGFAEVISTPFFDGRALVEIADQIQNIYW